MPKLLYAVPSGGHPHHQHAASIRALELTCRSFDRGVGDFITVRAPVQMARSHIADASLGGRCNLKHRHASDRKGCKMEPYDYVIMHDDDLLVAPQDGVEEPLVEGNPLDVWHAMMEADPSIGVIGAVYFRERPTMPNVAVFHEKHREELCHVISGMPPEPFDVDGLGTGFMMVRTSVFAHLDQVEDADGNPPLFRFPLEVSEWGTINVTGEDYDFCKRVRKLGYRVIADPRWDTVHIKERGPLKFNWREWEAGWAHGVPAFLHDEFRAACPPTFREIRIRGMRCLDHTAHKEMDAKNWRAREMARMQEAA